MAATGRIVDAVDFERVLKAPSAARTPHFAVHHLDGRPKRFAAKLSTGVAAASPSPVDDLPGSASWLGYVVPKRYAGRAVTRSLLKRQIRAAIARRPALANGLWVVRLRLAFDKAGFPSAASTALACAARAELDVLLAQAARRLGDAKAAPAPAGH